MFPCQAALKEAAQTYGGRGEEIAALRMEAEVSRFVHYKSFFFFLRGSFRLSYFPMQSISLCISNSVKINQTAREEANSVLEQFHNAEIELKSLRIAALRMILTQDEMVHYLFF